MLWRIEGRSIKWDSFNSIVITYWKTRLHKTPSTNTFNSIVITFNYDLRGTKAIGILSILLLLHYGEERSKTSKDTPFNSIVITLIL